VAALDELGCVPKFVRLLSSPSDDVKVEWWWSKWRWSSVRVELDRIIHWAGSVFD
jgi:hypothetical protein